MYKNDGNVCWSGFCDVWDHLGIDLARGRFLVKIVKFGCSNQIPPSINLHKLKTGTKLWFFSGRALIWVVERRGFRQKVSDFFLHRSAKERDQTDSFK